MYINYQLIPFNYITNHFNHTPLYYRQNNPLDLSACSFIICVIQGRKTHINNFYFYYDMYRILCVPDDRKLFDYSCILLCHGLILQI